MNPEDVKIAFKQAQVESKVSQPSAVQASFQDQKVVEGRVEQGVLSVSFEQLNIMGVVND